MTSMFPGIGVVQPGKVIFWKGGSQICARVRVVGTVPLSVSKGDELKGGWGELCYAQSHRRVFLGGYLCFGFTGNQKDMTLKWLGIPAKKGVMSHDLIFIGHGDRSVPLVHSAWMLGLQLVANKWVFP